MKKIFALHIAMLAILFFTKNSFANTIVNDDLFLKGKALFSFTPEYFIIQTNSYIFKISATTLEKSEKDKLEHAATNNSNIEIKIPRKAISSLWPTHPYKKEIDESKKYIKIARQLHREAKSNNGEFILFGKMAYSFSEPFFLIEAEKKVYQIKKYLLTPEQVESLTIAGPGGTVHAKLPYKAVSLVWNTKQVNKTSKIVSIRKDEAKIIDNQILIRGTVLLSFDEPIVLMESKDAIYRLRKDKIQTASQELLDKPGSKIQLRSSLSALDFVWPNSPKDPPIKFERVYIQ